MKCPMSLLVVLCAWILTSPAALAQSIAIVGGTIIDGNGGTPINDGVILIEGNRITAVGSRSMAIPPEARNIAAAGKYVIPGLMDANVHLILDATMSPVVLIRYEGRYDELAIEAAQVALRSGLTTIFDSWGPREELIKARDAINAGRIAGSRIYLAGNIVGLAGPISKDHLAGRGKEALSEDFTERINAMYQENVGPELVLMAPEQVRQEIRKYMRTGIDFFKYAVTAHRPGDLPFILFSPRVQQVMVEEARRAGIPVQTHTTSTEGVYLAVQAGVDLLQHCDITKGEPIPAETIALIAQRRIPCAMLVWTTKASAWMREKARRTKASTGELSPEELNQRALLRAGAVVLLSTDAGIFSWNTLSSGVIPPEENLWELGEGHFHWLLAVEQKGMKPMDALMAATRNIARAYKVDKDLGTLEKGKIADLLILDRNPLESAVNYRSISLVMKEGRIIDRGALPTQRLLTAETASRTGGS